MKEIRLRWASYVVHHEDMPKDGSSWTPATEEARRDYRTLVEICNKAFGAGSHWVEEREA